MKKWYKEKPDFYVAEQRIVKQKFPTLDYIEKDDKLFLVGMLYLDDTINDVKIIDSYRVEIEFPDNYPKSLPRVREVGGRKEELVEKRGLNNIRDLHYNMPNESACLSHSSIIRKICPEGSTIETILNELVIWFFYQQSYYEKVGNWPAGEYSHGVIGTREMYIEELGIDDDIIILNCVKLLAEKEQVKGHWACPCGSSLKFRDCHPGVFGKLYDLRKYISQIDAKKDFADLVEMYQEAVKIKNRYNKLKKEPAMKVNSGRESSRSK